MDSCCYFGLGTNTVLSKDSFKNVDNKFLGEKIKGSLLKSLASDSSSNKFRNRKLKPGVAFAIATPKNAKEALKIQPSMFERRRADPKNVAAIILGGGNGVKLFPLTKRAATPAVSYYHLLIETVLGKIMLCNGEVISFLILSSMGVYCFKTEALLKLLTWGYPSSNDFGSEIIPAAIREHNVQGYIFRDYWEDIGTVKSFYEANLALVEEIVNSIISHGCFLGECTIQRSIIGERSRLEYGVELQDTLLLGADNYQTESEIAALLAEGSFPIGIGRDTKIRKCIIDKNAKIGKNVMILNKDDVQEADRPEEGFYIRSGITVIVEKATIKDGTVI